MKLVVPTLPLFNQSKVHLQPDGEKLVLTKKRSALRYLQSMTMMMLRHVKMAKVQESPSSWHSSSSFAKVREIPQIGTPLFLKLYRTDGRTNGRTDGQTYPLIDLLAAGKNIPPHRRGVCGSVA